METPIDMEFNPSVHRTTEQGDPLRREDGGIQLKKRWRDDAVDRQGRTFNAHVHGEEPELDDQGFLKVRRRGEQRNLVSTTSRTAAFVGKYSKEGYQDYVMNDEGGRMEQFVANDWVPVIDEETNEPASISVGQARGPGTRAVLMRKPQEWYDEDQREKRRLNTERRKATISPDEAKGQYEADPSSPLR